MIEDNDGRHQKITYLTILAVLLSLNDELC